MAERDRETVVVDGNRSSPSGWAIALVVIILLIIAFFLFGGFGMFNGGGNGGGTTNINTSTPAPTTNP